MTCDYCNTDPGTKPSGVWKGFQDKDTNQFVCWSCQAKHYNVKFKSPETRNIYSEFPVFIPPAQLTLKFKTQ